MSEIRSRKTGDVLWTTDADTLYAAGLGGAILTDADLSCEDLSWANLIRADLTGADLTGADLSNATFTGAIFTDAILPVSVPGVPNIDRAILNAIRGGGCLEMGAAPVQAGRGAVMRRL